MNSYQFVKAISLSPDHSSKEFKITLPTACPICNIAYGESPLVNYYVVTPFKEYLYSFFFCPHCQKCFMTCSSVIDETLTEPPICCIDSFFPNSLCNTSFPEQIRLLSPNFVKIYHESEQAENFKLTKICGMGYRKALEFLVKDYAIRINPDSEKAIKETPLAKCINNYIADERIKTLAKASTWLGNDETHYVQKHKNFNISDLKRFINATTAYINYELCYLDALSFLNAPQEVF